LVLQGEPLPGAVDAVRSLEARGIPFRVVTNFSQLHRSTLASWFAKHGLVVDPERIITGTSATAAYVGATYPGRRAFVLAAEDARRAVDGAMLLCASAADAAPEGSVAAVVVGDAGDDLSYRNLDVAFRLVPHGAALLAATPHSGW